MLALAVIAGCAANPALVDSTPSQQPGSGSWADVGEYLDSLAAAMETVNYTAVSGETVEAEVLDTDVESEKLAEVSDLAPEGTLEAWSYSIYCKLDADVDEVVLAGGQQYKDGGWYCFETNKLVYALRYSDGSYDILRDVYHVDDGYGTASQQLYDWYVTTYDLDLPLRVLDWTDEINAAGYDYVSYTARLYNGDGWYLYLPIGRWDETADSEPGTRWVYGSKYPQSDSTITVELVSGAAEDETNEEDFDDHTVLTRTVPAGVNSHWLITARWSAATVASSDMEIASDPGTARLAVASFTLGWG